MTENNQYGLWEERNLAVFLFGTLGMDECAALEKGYQQCAECELWGHTSIVYFNGDDDSPYCSHCQAKREEQKHVISENFPSWAIVYLFYGDDGGITPDEKKLVDDFVDSSGCEWFEIASKSVDGHHFSWSPEFGLACNCVTLLGYNS